MSLNLKWFNQGLRIILKGRFSEGRYSEKNIMGVIPKISFTQKLELGLGVGVGLRY